MENDITYFQFSIFIPTILIGHFPIQIAARTDYEI